MPINLAANIVSRFEANKGVMSASCTQFGVADNTDDEIAEMSTSIQSVASSTGIDPRFILAIIMQESNGCVRAPTTNYGVRNPGLMQSHNGAGTCNDATVSNPCPSSEITQMITDGAAGTSSGDGLKQCLTESGATDVSMYYKAARIYNSGSIASGGNLGAGIATHCYASDVANRLIGWSSGPSACQSGTVGDLTSSESFVSGSSGSSDSSSAAQAATTTSDTAPAPTTSAEPKASTPATSVPGGAFIQTATSIAPEPTTTQASTPTSEPTPAVTTATVEPVPATTTAAPQAATTTAASVPASSSSASTALFSSAQTYPGATAGCQEWYTVQAGDDCDLVDQKFGILLSDLVSWNSGLDYSCSNLWLGYQYCVKA